jgi:hypothetical protein
VLALGSTRATAQAVPVPSDEARTLPAGVVRLGFLDDNSRFNDVWLPGGTLVASGQRLTFDTLGASQIPAFAPAQTSIRSLTADPTFVLNFGHLVTGSNVRVESFPLSLEAGITRRLTFRASVPIVHSRHTVFVNMNPTRFEGNVAINPAFASAQAQATNRGVTMQFLNAASTLQQVLAACQANPAGPNCATINGERQTLQTLIAQGTSFANGVTQVYGALVVPVTGSAAQNKINARDSSLTAQFNAAFQLAGLPGLTLADPVAAPARAGRAELDSVLTDTTFGIAADSLRDADTYGVGDAEVSATFLLFDTFHGNDTLRIHPHGFQMRTAVTGLVRLGTGKPPAENVLLDPGTGTGENAVEAHASTDLLFGRHLWATVTARGTYQLSDNVVTRIPGVAGQVLDPLYSRTTVRRQLGNAFEIEVDPRYTVNDYFAIYGLYTLRHKNDDSYTGTLSLDSAQTGIGPVRLDAAILGLNTAYTAQRIGFGLTFSTLAAAALRKHINLPVELSYLHYETITGTGGYLPKTIVDRVSARVYLRLFGRRNFTF